jgi:cell division GTPase FtsZ
MRVALVGVGQAGGKIAQHLAEYDWENEFDAVQAAMAVNTARADLQSLRIDTTLIGQDRVKGHGVGGDNELGAEIMQADGDLVMDDLDARVSAAVDAILLVAGLGGGTGSGGAPVLATELGRMYDLPVYVLGVLPGRGEGAIYQRNAGRSLKTVVREADATLLVDNDAWHDAGESVAGGFEEINDRIATRVGMLLGAGEIDHGEDVAESVVDSSEIINTLREGGTAALGYASTAAGENAGENVNAITSATRQAVLSNTSLPDAVRADAALLVVAGRPERIPRKGVERARKWLEEETGSLQVRGGDFPLETDELVVIVLLAGVEGSGRVEEFLERASQAQKEAEQREREREQDPDDAFQSDELEDLF